MEEVHDYWRELVGEKYCEAFPDSKDDFYNGWSKVHIGYLGCEYCQQLRFSQRTGQNKESILDKLTNVGAVPNVESLYYGFNIYTESPLLPEGSARNKLFEPDWSHLDALHGEGIQQKYPTSVHIQPYKRCSA